MAKTGCLIKSGGGTGQHVVELDDLLGLMFPLEYVDLDESQRRKNRTAASRAGGRPIRREAQLRSCQFLGGVGRCTTSYDTVLGSCVVVFKGRRPNFFRVVFGQASSQGPPSSCGPSRERLFGRCGPLYLAPMESLAPGREVKMLSRLDRAAERTESRRWIALESENAEEWPKGLLKETSAFKERWDVLVMVLIIYSAVEVPFRICFRSPAMGFVWGGCLPQNQTAAFRKSARAPRPTTAKLRPLCLLRPPCPSPVFEASSSLVFLADLVLSFNTAFLRDGHQVQSDTSYIPRAHIHHTATR